MTDITGCGWPTDLEPDEIEAILAAITYCYLAYRDGNELPYYADALDRARNKLREQATIDTDD